MIGIRVVPLAALCLAFMAMLTAVVAFTVAVINERRMQQHRQPGVGYWDVTLRRDGGWRRPDLFTDAGLALQKRAATWGMIGTACLVAALVLFLAGRLPQ